MKKFQQELDRLRQRVAEMGDRTELMLDEAIQTLWHPGESGHYQRVLGEEDHLDQTQLEIDGEAIRLLAVYSPVATSLRRILAVSRINSDLERIGDQAVNLCNHVQLMASRTEAALLPQFGEMTKAVRRMVRDALKAFLLDDSRMAQSVIVNDNLVDTLNDQVIRELLGGRAAQAEPGEIIGPLAQILISQALERIGDQASNICEQVVYMVEGADIRHGGEPPAESRATEREG